MDWDDDRTGEPNSQHGADIGRLVVDLQMDWFVTLHICLAEQAGNLMRVGN